MRLKPPKPKLPKPKVPKLRRRKGGAAPAPGAATATPKRDGPAPGESPANIDGLRAWVAQLERKLGTRFYALAAAAVLALAAGIVGLVLVLGVKEDSATKAELGQLRDEVAGVEQSATEAAEEDVAELVDRVSELESQLQGLRADRGTTEQELSVIQDDINDLRDDVATLEAAGDTDNP